MLSLHVVPVRGELLRVLSVVLVVVAVATVAVATRAVNATCPVDPENPTWHTPGLANTTCVPFCAGRCVLPGPDATRAGQRQNITMTRITPYEIDSPSDKDFGDLAGDFEFAILQKSMARRCANDTGEYMCHNGTGQFLKPGSPVGRSCPPPLLLVRVCCRQGTAR